MGDVKNLQEKQAVDKLKKMVDEIKTCLFCTQIKTGESFTTRPMSTQKVDDEGNLWFLSDKNSNKNAQIREDDGVQLLYTNKPHEGFLSIAGHAEIQYDRNKIKELWEPIAKAWFTEGENDPRISVIKVTPTEGYYWDTKHGKMVSFVKILTAMVTGNQDDGGIEGRLNP
jgi:general stress protein 26